MFGDDDFDNSAIDLNRVRKLAGLPDTSSYQVPSDTYEPEEVSDLSPDDIDSGMDNGMDDLPVVATPAALPAPMDAPVMDMDAPSSHWTAILAELEKQLSDIPVGDFRDVIDSLRRLANYAEDIRRSLVTEGRKSFKDYIAKNLEEDMAGEDQLIGNNRQEAIKSLQTRLGGKPQDAAKAQQIFNNLQAKGKIKAKGSQFTMQTMTDDDFTSTVNDPMLNQ